VPLAEQVHRSKQRLLFDHLVGATRERKRNRDPKRVSGLEVQEQLDFRGLLYRQLARLFAFENTGDIDAGETVSVRDAAAIARQTASGGELAVHRDRRNGVAECQRGKLFLPGGEKRIGGDDEPARSQLEPQTKKFTEPPEQIRKEIAALKADKSVPEPEKKEDLALLEAALKNAKPIQFKENITLVLKYFDKLPPLMQEQGPAD
jgi:hypothetical protein